MRLGIDFGTTHTVATLVDRGNYPVIGFEWGDTFPSLLAVAEPDGELRFGPDALAVADQPGWRLVRSFKRLLGARKVDLADEATIQKVTGAPVGFAGPVGSSGCAGRGRCSRGLPSQWARSQWASSRWACSRWVSSQWASSQ